MPPAGFETKISAGERPETHALDRTANRSVLIYITLNIALVNILLTVDY